MNYYEHHIGDYAEATAHLSFVEDAAYSRLIRKYYAMEGPLPADLRAVQRLICARTEDEREAVEIILGEFFTLQDDGYHNARCDEEISRYLEKQDKARRSANARWNKGKQHSDGDASDSNAALPPQSERNANASKPMPPSNANASTEPCERIKSECEGNAHQSPDTNTQEPYGSFVGVAHEHAKTTLPDDFLPNVAHRGIAVNQHLDLANELGMFIAHCKETAKLSANWDASFEAWLRRSRKFGNGKDQQRQYQPVSAAQQKSSSARGLFANHQQETRHERTIDGECTQS